MYLNSDEIKGLAYADNPLIYDFVNKKVSMVDGRIVASYGLAENCYDVRIAETPLELVVPTASINPNKDNHAHPVLDIKKDLNEQKELAKLFIEPIRERDGTVYFLVPPKTMVLAHTVEKFNIPNDISGVLYCKSSYARVGMNMAPTTLKSGWSGQLVLEIYNQTNIHMRVYANEGIGTIYFSRHTPSDDNVGYNGVYQDQTGITHAKTK